MNILHIINSFQFGGAENLIVSSIPFFEKSEFDFEFLSITNNLDLIEDKSSMSFLNNKTSKSLQTFFDLYIYFKNNEYDIIHAHLFPTTYFCSLLKKIGVINSKLVLTEHNTHNRRRDFLLFKPVERTIYNEYEKIVCISKGTELNLNKWLNSLKDKTEIIYNGVDIEKFNNNHETKNITKKKEIKIAMVASFSPQKDQMTLIKSLKLLPQKYRVYFAGDGDEINNVKKFVNKNNLENRVNFLGNVYNIPEFLKQMDLFVLSSIWEGFGLVVIEAMASKLPVIASNIAGLSEIVNGYGEIFQKENYKELSDKILKVTRKQSIYNSYVNKSKLRAKDFTIKKMVKNYLNLYNSL